jgi:hypothetical protein
MRHPGHVTPCITTSHGVSALARAGLQLWPTSSATELFMRRVVQVITTLLPAAYLAACASPTAPSQAPCLSGKVPYASCTNQVKPNNDYINPMGDYINPMGSIGVKGE